MPRALVFGLLLVACAPPAVPAAGGTCFAPCTRNSDCASPWYCHDGECVIDALAICSVGKTRCNGNDIEVCVAGEGPDACPAFGGTWSVLESCPHGCSNNQCRAASCTANERRCDGTMLFQCLSNGSGWVFTQQCATTCNAGVCAASP